VQPVGVSAGTGGIAISRTANTPGLVITTYQ
jgi:hypothetical protein